MCRKADDAGGLAPVKEDNAAARKIGRQDSTFFKFIDYMLYQGKGHRQPGAKQAVNGSAFNGFGYTVD